MKKRIYLAAIALGIGMLLSAGCGDGGKDTNGSSAFFDYDVNDYVTLGDYKGLAVQYPVPTVTEDDIQIAIEDLLDEKTDYIEVTDRGAENGDYLNIDFTGTIDGKEFDGGSAEDYELTLGNEEMLVEFDQNLVGKKAGETAAFKVVFSEDYDEELAGQEAEFQVTVNTVSEINQPEYNDAFVAEATEYKTTAEYEEALRGELIASAQAEAAESAGTDALQLAVDNATINGYPESLYEACYQDTVDSYQAYAEMFGMEFEEFMSEFMEGEDLEEVTISLVNEVLVSQAIAEKEGLTITDKEYDQEAEALATEYGYTSLEDFTADYGQVSIMSTLIKERAMNFLYENAQVEEVSEEDYNNEEDYDEEEAEATEEGENTLGDDSDSE